MIRSALSAPSVALWTSVLVSTGSTKRKRRSVWVMHFFTVVNKSPWWQRVKISLKDSAVFAVLTGKKAIPHFDLKYDGLDSTTGRSERSNPWEQHSAIASAMIVDTQRTGPQAQQSPVCITARKMQSIHLSDLSIREPFTILFGIRCACRKMPYLDKRPGGIELAVSYLGSINRRRMKVVH
jgi:hypothetical protein